MSYMVDHLGTKLDLGIQMTATWPLPKIVSELVAFLSDY